VKLLSELYDSVIVVQDGKIRFTRRVPLISGYTDDEVMDKNFLDLIAPEEREHADKIYKALERKQKIPSIITTKIVSKKGKIIPIEASIRAIELEGRVAALVSLRDISKGTVK
jgi:PAS domain S-box-containing protein